MINSMTGYGHAEGRYKGVTYVVEVKTVNNRYFKDKIKLPDSLLFLEESVEKLLQKALSRGMVNYTLRLKDVSADVLFEIDEKALKSYVEKLSRINTSAGVDGKIDITGLMTLPGIIMPVIPSDEEANELEKFVLDITQKAIEQLKQMRKAEGAALEADLAEHCDVIMKSLEKIRQRRDLLPREYQKKLKSRVESLMTGTDYVLDEQTLAREIAIYAERSDISEEIIRLESHLKQFEDCMRSDEQSGRRLDFISQELLREANTIASKSNDFEVASSVVEIKCRIDRIKEQVQNVE